MPEITTHATRYFTADEALATLAGIGTEYIVCYDHASGQFLAGLSHLRQPSFRGSWIECLAAVGNEIAAEVEAEEERPEGERLAVVTPEGDVR